MTRTYRLNYESAEVMYALFDRAAASQGWRISARVMRDYIEYFGPKTEQLDFLAQEGKVIFTSFTEKIQDGKGQSAFARLRGVVLTATVEVLKQPLETAITLHTQEFEDFHMRQDMHIAISVKDFRAIVTHAETLRGTISAHFSLPTRPLQFSYQNSGVHCEFTLMTTGDYRGAMSTPNPNFISTRASSRQTQIAPAAMLGRDTSEMPPPTRPPPRKPLRAHDEHSPVHAQRKSEHVIGADHNSGSLFVSGEDDDRYWDPPNLEQQAEEEMLGWDASMDAPSASFRPIFRDSVTRLSQQQQNQPPSLTSQEGLEPTQRLSEVSEAIASFFTVANPSSCTVCSTDMSGLSMLSASSRLSVQCLKKARSTAGKDSRDQAANIELVGT